MFSGHMLLLLTWLSGPKMPPAVNSITLTRFPCKTHHTTQFSNNDAIKIQSLSLFPLLTVSTVLYKAGNSTDFVVTCVKVELWVWIWDKRARKKKNKKNKHQSYSAKIKYKMAYTAYEKINMTLRTNCIKKCLCYSITIGQYRHFTVKEPKFV